MIDPDYTTDPALNPPRSISIPKGAFGGVLDPHLKGLKGFVDRLEALLGRGVFCEGDIDPALDNEDRLGELYFTLDRVKGEGPPDGGALFLLRMDVPAPPFEPPEWFWAWHLLGSDSLENWERRGAPRPGWPSGADAAPVADLLSRERALFEKRR